MKRRGFFQTLAKAAVIAVAAPIIVRELIKPQMFISNSAGIYAQLQDCGDIRNCRVVVPSKEDLDEMFKTYYAIKRKKGVDKC